MRFAAKASDLAVAAARVAKIGPSKIVVPILGHVLIRAENSSVTFTGHDLDRSLAVAVEADVSKPGAATCDAKRFAKLLVAIDGETEVKVSADENGLTLQAGRSRYKFDTLVPGDFPPPLAPGQRVEEGEEPQQLAEMALDEAARHRLFEMTQFAISTEETRYYLNGVFLSATDDQATGVATDGHRIIRSFANVTRIGNWPAIIVPRPAVASIVALGADKLSTDGRILQAVAEGIVFASKTIDGTYPDWRRVVPQPSGNSVEFDVDEMLGALKRMQAVADKDDVSKRGGICKLIPFPDQNDLAM